MATSIIPVANETISSSSRMTKEGKKITYQMSVIQQPERARACGSGAKSSADRRPVDPPPIVELRIFEGENRQDITFSYNANFFLFATLENARTIAQGRVQPNPASFPVLTGTPVAGMAYLDRPTPAGYFIFPDLSVRHEGKYRLSFALYEELKEPKDMDSDDRGAEHVQNGRVDAHVSHRLEVKSAPFSVFSAKKFPGLTESTALSRMVAEQGCRVRIRRDVRMRRRDNKTKDEWDDYEEKTAYERNRTATPDVYGQNAVHTPQPMTDGSDRPRSQSNASNASFAPPPRRPSMQDMANSYQQGYQSQMPPPQAPQNAYSSQMQYPAAPAPQYQSQYPPAQQQAAMQPPQAPYMPSHHSWQPQPQPQQMPMAQQYGYSSNQQYGHYEQPQAPVRHDSIDYSSTPSEYRRPSLAGPQQTPNQMMAPTPFGTLDSGYNRHQSQMNPPPAQPMPSSQAPHHPNASSQAPASTHPMNGYSLAPLKTLQPPAEKLEPVSPSYPMSAPGVPMSAPVPTPNEPLVPRAYPGSKQYNGHSDSSNPALSGSTKRSFSATFDTNHIEQPLRGGARPNVNLAVDENSLSALDASTDEEILDERAMSYRRADGTHRSRRVPLSN